MGTLCMLSLVLRATPPKKGVASQSTALIPIVEHVQRIMQAGVLEN